MNGVAQKAGQEEVDRRETLDDSATAIPPSFAAELERLMKAIQRALNEMLVEWGSPTNAIDLEKLSGVGTPICWRVFRVVRATDVVAEARNVPSPVSLQRLLDVGKAAGVSPATAESVLTAVAAFKAFGRRVAHDRSAFDAMLAGVNSENAGEKLQMSQLRASYRAMSHINGVQADFLAFSALIGPLDQSNASDWLNVMSLRRLRRLRPGAEMVIYGSLRDSSGKEETEFLTTAGVGPSSVGGDESPILPEFSSMPLPQVRRRELQNGFTMYDVVDTEVGMQGAIDCTLAQLTRAEPLLVEPDGRKLYHSIYQFTQRPVAASMHEIVVHRASFPNIRPAVMVYKTFNGPITQKAVEEAPQYPVDCRLTKLGPADEAGSPEWPQYPQAMRYIARRLGWDLADFDVWRVKLQFPIMYSSVCIYFYVD